jgi:hypothetical protein
MSEELMNVQHKHFLGATITRLADFVSNGRINFKNIYFVFVHVGTNDVSSSQSVDTSLSFYGDLIHKIKSKTDAKIIFTFLLPRLVDFKLSEIKLNKVNSELRRLCNRRSLLFCNLYRSCLHNNKPDPLFTHPKMDST